MPVMSSDISSLSNVNASSSETLPLLDYTSTVEAALQAGTATMPPAQTQTFELTSSQRVDPVEGTRDQVLTEVETTSPCVSSAPVTPSPNSSPEGSPDIKTSHQEEGIEHLKDAVIFDTQKTKLEDEQLSVSAASFSQDGDICRICHCCAGEEAGSLISPCDCSGSMKWVHQKCLQKWVKSRDARKCELCGFSFNMTSSVKPFRKWSKLNMSSVEQRRVLCSVTFHVVAITCVIWSLYVLIDRTAVEIKSGDLNWPFWTKLVVVAIGFTGGLVFMYVQCKTYVKLFRRWKQFNRIIYINNVEVENAPGNDLDGEDAPTANTIVLKDVAAGAVV